MFKLEFETDNAAFEAENMTVEICRILREVANRIDGGQFDGKVRDVNGNTVGEFSLKD